MNVPTMNVPKPISTKMHGVLDYLTVGFALAFPRVLNCNKTFTDAVTMLALGKLGYGLLSRHELAAHKWIPMPAHLAMDAVGGAALCALPFLTGEDDPAAVACAIGMGVFDIVAAPLTETEMRQRAIAGRAADQSWIPQAPSFAAGIPSGTEAERQDDPDVTGGRFGASTANHM